MNKQQIVGLGSFILLIVLTGCGGTNDTANNGDVPGVKVTEKPKPVTLTVFTDAKTTMEIEKPLVEAKFPHITLNVIENGNGITIEKVVAGGQRIDMLNHSIGSIWKLNDLDLLSDLSPLIKKHTFDLNRYAAGVADSIKSYSDKGEIIALPYELSNNVVFYNKNIFNKFGIPYPKDGMTWDEV